MKTTTKKKLKAIFFPERCPYCRDVIRPLEMYCEECKETMPAHNYKKNILGVYEAFAVTPYEGPYKNAILRIKSGKRKQYAYQLAKYMAEKLLEEFEELSFNVITYVPLHPEDFKNRGFNQCELISKHLSEILKIPYEPLLKKTRKNKPQHDLPASKRKKNVEGVFKAVDKSKIPGKKILLIDDIVTTGCTLGECIKVLEENGASDIYCMTFAITLKKTT